MQTPKNQTTQTVKVRWRLVRLNDATEAERLAGRHVLITVPGIGPVRFVEMFSICKGD